jgi:hypothetical protein
MKKNRLLYFLPLALFASIFISFYYGEDTLGRARLDSIYHERFIYLFAENFRDGLQKYGTEEFTARNSPIFYIISSIIFNLGVSVDNLKYFNLISLLSFFLLFIKCLTLKYPNISPSHQILFGSIIFISPTIRSLTVWPYPLTWGLLFFLISIYYFLKFKLTQKLELKTKYSIFNVISLAISSYITPNFAIFAIFYLFIFFNSFKVTKQLFYVISINLILAFPAFYYYLMTDFYIFKYNVWPVDTFTKYNITNKIIIITSLIFFYFIPFTEIKRIELNKLNLIKSNKSLFFITLFFLVNILLFNFPTGFGGGIFYHLSFKIFNNFTLLIIIFLISIILFDIYGLFTKQNIILFICLIFYNTHDAIYHKYFDPLIYFIIFFLMQFKDKISLNNKLFYKIFSFYSFFWILSVAKKFISYQ